MQIAIVGAGFTPGEADRLRKAMGGYKGKVTVPVWITGDAVINESHEIAERADAEGNAQKLFLEGRDADMADASALAHRICDAARGRSLVRVLDDRAAVKEALPKMVTRIPLVSGTVGRTVLKRFNAKYGIVKERYEEFHQQERKALLALRDMVTTAKEAGRITLYERFSYADVALGLALNLVKPLPGSPMGPASTRCATDAEIGAEFADLLEWRDALDAEVGLLP